MNNFKRNSNESEYVLNFKELKKHIKSGEFNRIYAFFGEEQYLLETYLEKMRSVLIPDGLDVFNHRRFSGKSMSLDELSEALEAYPAMSEYTLTEIDDLDFSSLGESGKKEILTIFNEIPDYAVLILRFDTVELKLDGRSKTDSAIKKKLFMVEFEAQKGAGMVKWVTEHVRATGHDISAIDADYFAFYTGGLMAALNSEIDKVCYSCEDKIITRRDIERMAIPAVNAAVYNITDAILRGEYSSALSSLSQMLDMETEPRILFAAISNVIRQLYFTKIALKYGKDQNYIVKSLNLGYPFLGGKLIEGAKRKSDKWCEQAMHECNETAYRLNTSAGIDEEQMLVDLVLRMAAHR